MEVDLIVAAVAVELFLTVPAVAEEGHLIVAAKAVEVAYLYQQ